jgi:hypothetical protein
MDQKHILGIRKMEMVEAQRLTNETGQVVTIFTADQQLYRIVVDITWVYPDLFKNFIPKLKGMHMLMSFVGAIGTPMCNRGQRSSWTDYGSDEEAYQA